MLLTDRQWQLVLPIIRGGAKELEISVDTYGNAVVVGKAEQRVVSLKIRGNVIPFPKANHTKTLKKSTFKEWVVSFMDFLGVVLWGEDDFDEERDQN